MVQDTEPAMPAAVSFHIRPTKGNNTGTSGNKRFPPLLGSEKPTDGLFAHLRDGYRQNISDDRFKEALQKGRSLQGTCTPIPCSPKGEHPFSSFPDAYLISFMDVLDALASLHHEHPHLASIDVASVAAGITLPILPALLVFFAAGTALGLCIFFIVSLSDLTDPIDPINPYTFEARINPKLKLELVAHGSIVLALIMCHNPIVLLVALPTVAVRGFWFVQRKLEVDSTTCYHDRTQGSLRIRWSIMAAWHAIALVFAFTQMVLHAALSLA
jgi:hypothetical protein